MASPGLSRDRLGASGARIGVVIASRNRAEGLLGALDRLAALPERPPIVVVDNASQDGTPSAVARRHPGTTVIRLAGNLGAAARNTGVQALGTPLVAFSDDDSWWAPGALARAASLFEAHPRLAVLAARVLIGKEQRLDPTASEMSRSPLGRDRDMPGPSVLGFLACGAVVRRSAYLEAGGFHPRFGVGGEEALLALDLAAAGWGVCYVDAVVAHHFPSRAVDRRNRRPTQLRNSLWCAWLRRGVRPSAAHALRLIDREGLNAALVRSFAAAVCGLPWLLAERRLVPAQLERQLRLLEAPTTRSSSAPWRTGP